MHLPWVQGYIVKTTLSDKGTVLVQFVQDTYSVPSKILKINSFLVERARLVHFHNLAF